MRTQISKRMILVAILISFFFGNLKLSASDTVKIYYRHLVYNHVSPYFAYKGSYQINEVQAGKMRHYCFCYLDNRLVKIISKGNDWKIHALAFIGAPIANISYETGKEIWKFYNEKGAPTVNYRGVYVEEYELANNERKSLKFYNSSGEPMLSNWGIWEYTWKKRDSLIVESRFNKTNDLMSLSSYFPFRITGFAIGENGFSKVCYNLGENGFAITNSSEGIACYRDNYDDNNNHTKYTYYNKVGIKVKNTGGYTTSVKTYDSLGYMIKEFFLDNTTILSSKTYNYNSFGDIYYDGHTTISQNQYINLNIEIYPNPCIDKILGINIADQYCGEVGINIYSIEGKIKSSYKLLKQEYQTDFTIPIIDLSTGIYFIEFRLDRNINFKRLVVL